MIRRVMRRVALFTLLGSVFFGMVNPARAEGKPVLLLPTPRGETWEVIQGYNCGTHDGWGRLSFDIVNHDGRTYGAPVYAAAAGTVFFYAPASGSLILSHGGGYYTMYSHLSAWLEADTGTYVEQGQWIGAVGSTHIYETIPHLHFTFFAADGAYAYNRRPVALAFADAESYPDHGRCNEYAGELLTASGIEDSTAPTLEWSDTPSQTWIKDGRLSWTISDDNAVAGFSQAWDNEISDEQPHFADALEGYLDLEIGKHTANVKVWDKAGNTATFTREIWYDPIPPTAPQATKQANHEIADVADFTLTWQASNDAESGIRGYQLYFGKDAQGTSDWFVSETQVGMTKPEAGTYYLRVRAQDNAGNFSDWQTLGTYSVK